jgi:hypothetical protein
VNYWFLIIRNILFCTKKNTEALDITSKEIGLEVNAEKTKYMVISHDQHAGQNHNIKTGNKSFERVEQFRYSEQLQQIIIPFMKKLKAN